MASARVDDGRGEMEVYPVGEDSERVLTRFSEVYGINPSPLPEAEMGSRDSQVFFPNPIAVSACPGDNG
jgi:hypothetical protein